MITGGPCCGKTSVINELKKRGHYVLEEIAREILSAKEKWNFKDLEYLEAACKAYETFKDREKICYINREINLKTREKVFVVKDWIERVREKELVLV